MPLLYLLLLFHISSTFSVTISPSTIIEWSDRFSLKFANDVNTTMRVPALQKMYDQAPKIVIQVDGSVEVSAAAASVGSILDSVDHEIDKIALKLQRNQSALLKDMSFLSLSSSNFLRSYFVRAKESSIDLLTSDSKETSIALTVQQNGFDATTTPWYVDAVTGPKDIFIVVDLSMNSQSQAEIRRTAVNSVLDTISPNDVVTVYVLHNSYFGPLDKICSKKGTPLRGTRDVVLSLKQQLVKKSLSLLNTNTNTSTTYSQKRWQQIFRVMFNTVDEVRSANTNQEGSNGNGGRGGGEGRSAALILFTTKGGGPRAAGLMFKLSPKDGRPVLANQEDTTWHEENADHNFREIQDDTKWHEADEVRNVHEIPIFTFQFAEIIESSHDDHEKLHYRCDSLGILSNNSITTLSHARDVKHMYLHLIALPTNFDKISSTVHFWGGLIHSMNQTIRDYADIQTGKSNTLNVMTFTRAVYVNNKLLGVIGLDHTLSNLKNSLDSISNKMGQDSFPILATASGDTIYHQLNERYSHSTLFNVGKDIGDLEYFPSFSEQVRIPFLNGLIGSKILIVMRALAAGDATTEGFEGRLIETYYYYTPVPKWNLRILLAYDQFDLQKTSLKPSSDVKLDRLITSQIEDYQSVDNQYLLVLNTATEKNGAVFYNDHNCASSNSGLAFSNCKPDEYCRRVLLGISHPKGTVAGAPQCVDDSDCRCEPHRWPIGLTSRDSSVVGIAPRSLDKSSQAFELLEKFKLMTSASIEEKRKLTRKMTLFLNSDPSSASLTEQRVSVDALNQVPFAAKIGQTWREEHTRTGKHNNTVWVYYGSHTGISSIYPANNWGFTWDPTRRPWYMRAITQGSKNITSVISTPYIDGGGVGLISTLASPVWGSSMDPSTSHVLGVVGYDFIYSTMHQFVSSLTDGICSTKNIRDMNNGNGNNNEKDVACFLFDFSGLLLTHSDFLATEEEKKAALSFGVTIDHVDEGDWPIQNVFIGKKEPDLGNALIKSGVIVPQSSTSPDSMRMVSFYKVNMDIFTVEKQVIQGEITLNDNPSCLQTTENSPIKWFVKPIKHSNALLLVVPGYRRRSDKECTTTVAADPPTTMPHHLKPRCSHDVATTSLFDAKDDAAIRYSGRGKSWQRSANTNTCPRCQPGFYNGDVGGKCRACLHGSFSDRFGAGSCSLCVAGKYSMTPGIPKCNVCQQGMYSLEIGASNYPCKPFEHCPNGADCRQSDGLRIKNLVPLNGHWRANSTSSSFVDCSLAYYGLQRQTYASKRCCPYFSGMNETTTETTTKGNIRLPTICNETLQWNHSSDSQCHTGYIGKLCASCAEDYVFHFDGCKLCPGGSSIGWALVSIFVGGLFSFGVVVCILQPCCVKRIILYDEDSDDATIIGQVKIIVTFCQLSAFSTAVFNGVPWPSEFLTMTSTLSLVNFDFADFISTWLCSVSVAPLDRFLMLMITPAFVAAGIYGAYYIHLFSCNDYINVCKRKESLHHLEEQRTRKKILNKVHDWERRAMMMKVLVLCALWMYPVLASSLFSVFRCRIIEGVEGGPWLHMDLSIACYQEKHMPYVIAAVFGMIFYVFGMPLAVFAELWFSRRHLYDTESIKHRAYHFEYGSIYLQYEPEYFWYELVIMFYKMMMTGLLSLVAPGSPVQMMIALFICLLYLMFLLKLTPYSSDLDDFSAIFSAAGYFLVILFGLVLALDGDPSEVSHFDSHVVGNILVVITIIVIFVNVCCILIVLVPICCQKKKIIVDIIKRNSFKRSISYLLRGGSETEKEEVHEKEIIASKTSKTTRRRNNVYGTDYLNSTKKYTIKSTVQESNEMEETEEVPLTILNVNNNNDVAEEQEREIVEKKRERKEVQATILKDDIYHTDYANFLEARQKIFLLLCTRTEEDNTHVENPAVQSNSTYVFESTT